MTNETIEELKAKVFKAKIKLETFTERPATTAADTAAKNALEKELSDAKAAIAELVISGAAPAPANPVISDMMYLEAQLLCQHLSSLAKFTGASSEDATTFCNKVKAISESCVSLEFSRIYAALKPKLSTNVLKTLELAKIKDIDDLVKCIHVNYGSAMNVYQRMESWQNRQKPFNKAFTTFHSEIVASLEPIISGFEDMVTKNKLKADPSLTTYVPSFRDAFQLFLAMKTLQSIRQESTDLYSSIVVELSTFSSPDQLAARAQALSVQTAYSSVNHAESRRPGNSSNRKGNNSGANNDRRDDDDRQNNASSNNQNNNNRRRRQNNGNNNQGGQNRQNHGNNQSGNNRSNGGNTNRSNGNANSGNGNGANGNQSNRSGYNRNNAPGYPPQTRPYRAPNPAYNQQVYGTNAVEPADCLPPQGYEYFQSSFNPDAAPFAPNNMYNYNNASYYADPNPEYSSKN